MTNVRKKSVQINFKASEKLTAYLYALIDEEGFGSTPTAVVQSLLWQKIIELTGSPAIKKIEGEFSPTNKT